MVEMLPPQDFEKGAHFAPADSRVVEKIEAGIKFGRTGNPSDLPQIDLCPKTTVICTETESDGTKILHIETTEEANLTEVMKILVPEGVSFDDRDYIEAKLTRSVMPCNSGRNDCGKVNADLVENQDGTVDLAPDITKTISEVTDAVNDSTPEAGESTSNQTEIPTSSPIQSEESAANPQDQNPELVETPVVSETAPNMPSTKNFDWLPLACLGVVGLGAVGFGKWILGSNRSLYAEEEKREQKEKNERVRKAQEEALARNEAEKASEAKSKVKIEDPFRRRGPWDEFIPETDQTLYEAVLRRLKPSERECLPENVKDFVSSKETMALLRNAEDQNKFGGGIPMLLERVTATYNKYGPNLPATAQAVNELARALKDHAKDVKKEKRG